MSRPRERRILFDEATIYVGLEIADEFMVGYGLDYMERYRNLPCMGVLRKDLVGNGVSEQ